MTKKDLEAMSLDALHRLYGEVSIVLEKRIKRKIDHLQQIFEQLDNRSLKSDVASKRGARSKTKPKYRNPKRPHEVWSGRGKRPRWLNALIRAGKNIEDFRLERR